MARRNISAAEERQLIADAEAHRDSGTRSTPARLRPSEDATAVLSVRLPMSQLRALRAVAAARGASLSAVLQDAVDQLVAERGPRMTVSQRVHRLYVAGATPELGNLDQSTVVTSNCQEAVRTS
jgi:hypothetical protein